MTETDKTGRHSNDDALGAALYDAFRAEESDQNVVLGRPDSDLVATTTIDGEFDLPAIARRFVRAAQERRLI